MNKEYQNVDNRFGGQAPKSRDSAQNELCMHPNCDRYDTDDPPAPGVLGGWLPELQGECRPGCENLPRDVTINTNYGRVNGFFVYLYDGPR